MVSLTNSLLFFGIPGFAAFLGVYYLVPVLEAQGVPLIASWSFAIWAPMVVWFIWFVGREVFRPGSLAFSQRFRLRRISPRQWLLILGAFVVLQLAEILLHGTSAVLARFAFFAPPPVIPELFDPQFQLEGALTEFMGIPTKGNWWLVAFWLGWLIVNIGGEELLWRGYALPLQEKVFGKWAWLVNGLCWNLLFHFFMRWSVLTIMPISLLIPYLVQRYQNTWIGIVLHGAGNLLVLVVLIPGIMAD